MKIPLFRIYWDENDIKSVDRIIRSGKSWCVGKEIEEFERKIADYLGVKYCVTTNSGSSALHALMLAHGFGNGDEVIVPSFTFIATAYAPMYVGAKPVFADVEEKSLGLDPDDVRKKITKRTKAILPIHYGGIPCRIKELREIADEHGLKLIEDAAESFGAKVNGKQTGSFGDSAILSFCQNKIFTTSEGGAAVTDNKQVYDRLRLITSYGRVSSGDYFAGASADYVSLGFNWRMSSLLASLGLSQLKKADRLISMRRKNAEYLNRKLRGIGGIRLVEEPKDSFAVYQLYTIRAKKRDSLMGFLAKRGITSKVYFDPIHRYKVFRGYNANLPVTDRMSKEVLTLPMYPGMTRKEMDYIIDNIQEFYGGIKDRR